MALKMDYIIPDTTISIVGAYHRISMVSQTHPMMGAEHVSITVTTSKDATDRDNDLYINSSTRQYSVTSTQSGYATYFSETELKKVDKSIIEQAYMYLKSLSEYATATDE